jgi:hypothetical protein
MAMTSFCSFGKPANHFGGSSISGLLFRQFPTSGSIFCCAVYFVRSCIGLNYLEVGLFPQITGPEVESGISVDESSFSLGFTFDLQWACSVELFFYPFHPHSNKADAACPKRPSSGRTAACRELDGSALHRRHHRRRLYKHPSVGKHGNLGHRRKLHVWWSLLLFQCNADIPHSDRRRSWHRSQQPQPVHDGGCGPMFLTDAQHLCFN